MRKDRASYALAATQPCSGELGHGPREDHILGRCDSKRRTVMAHLLVWHVLQRANTILMLGMLWSGLAACVIGALAYDLAFWFGR
jgi:hypothetical protein